MINNNKSSPGKQWPFNYLHEVKTLCLLFIFEICIGHISLCDHRTILKHNKYKPLCLCCDCYYALLWFWKIKLVFNKQYLPLPHGNLQKIVLTYHFQPPFSLMLYYVWFSNISNKGRFRTKISGLRSEENCILRPPLLITCQVTLVRLLNSLDLTASFRWAMATLGVYGSSSQEKKCT